MDKKRKDYEILKDSINQLAIVSQTSETYPTDLYEETLAKVLNSDDDGELIYIFAKNVENAPIRLLAEKMILKSSNPIEDIKKDKWRVEFAKNIGEIDLESIWKKLKSSYNSKDHYIEYFDFTYDFFEKNIILFSTIDNVPINEIFDFLRENVNISGNVMKSFFEASATKLDIHMMIDIFREMKPLKISDNPIVIKDHPISIYTFVYNYKKQIPTDLMDEIIEIFISKLKDYYCISFGTSFDSGGESYFSCSDDAIDTLFLFIKNIDGLTKKQQRLFVSKTLSITTITRDLRLKPETPKKNFTPHEDNGRL